MKFRNPIGTLGSALLCTICCNLLPATAQTNGLMAAPTAIAQAQTPDISPSFRAKIERLLELSGGRDSIRAFTPELLQQLFASQQIPPRAAEIAVEEFEIFFNDESIDSLIEAQIPIYAKYYTEADLDGLIEFYETPFGQKFAAVAPAIVRDSVQVSQQWALERLPQFIERLQMRFEEEGIQP